MKKAILVLVLLCAAVLGQTMSVIAQPEALTIQIHQAQFQCRLWDPPGWRYIYQNYDTEMDLSLTGNVLHAVISYQPAVTEEEGTSMVYVYSKNEGVWILHEGTIKYTSPYSGLTITEYWRGYLEFDEDTSFQHGVGYQWGFIYGEDPRWYYTHAVWDETMGAWLLGFSIYMWDPVSETQNYDIPFPEPFIEPVPSSDYNPLDL